jgi:hypothetical protein
MLFNTQTQSNPMMYPIECSDKYGMQGIADTADLVDWLNSWLRDEDSTRCVIEKVGPTGAYLLPKPPKD